VNGGGFVVLGVFVALALLIPAGILAYEAEVVPGWLGFEPVALGAAADGFGAWLARQSE
jgi:hypothetical protein